MTRDTLFSVDDRVRHAVANLTGTVERLTGEYVRVRWDHYGLAVAQLGTMADLQRPEDLVKVDE